MLDPKSYVNSETELRAALANPLIDTIQLTTCIALEAPLDIKRSVTIDGANCKFNLFAAKNIGGILINIGSETPINVTLKNLGINASKAGVTDFMTQAAVCVTPQDHLAGNLVVDNVDFTSTIPINSHKIGNAFAVLITAMNSKHKTKVTISRSTANCVGGDNYNKMVNERGYILGMYSPIDSSSYISGCKKMNTGMYDIFTYKGINNTNKPFIADLGMLWCKELGNNMIYTENGWEPIVGADLREFLDRDGVSELSKAILTKVNVRIEDRIVKSINEDSDHDHVPSVLAVYDIINNMNQVKFKTITGSIEDIENPDSNYIYLQRDDPLDPIWVLYVYDQEIGWIKVGDSEVNLSNYWSKSADDLEALKIVLNLPELIAEIISLQENFSNMSERIELITEELELKVDKKQMVKFTDEDIEGFVDEAYKNTIPEL